MNVSQSTKEIHRQTAWQSQIPYESLSSMSWKNPFSSCTTSIEEQSLVDNVEDQHHYLQISVLHCRMRPTALNLPLPTQTILPPRIPGNHSYLTVDSQHWTALINPKTDIALKRLDHLTLARPTFLIHLRYNLFVALASVERRPLGRRQSKSSLKEISPWAYVLPEIPG